MSTKKNTELINPKREPITPEKLRKLSGLNLSDEEAEEVIGSLTRFAWIVIDFTIQQEQAAKLCILLHTRPKLMLLIKKYHEKNVIF
ncbi:MAG TPA: hypothetical protein VHD83_06195 [Puia sp.]|nr:hypothetical protein [Puia sp.]